MTIRTATIEDLEAVSAVEAACFPLAEAATPEEFRDRLERYANHFWLMFDGDRLVSFVDGLVHISEIANRYVKHPSEVLSVGDVVQVKVLTVDEKKKRIGLSIKQAKS